MTDEIHYTGLLNNQDTDIDDVALPVDEVSRYMESLVRDYMGAVMERYQMQEESSIQILDEPTILSLIQAVAAGLEQDRDVTLAYLLRAALARTLNDDGATAGQAYLQAVLEDLLRHQDADAFLPPIGRSSPAERPSGITILLENESIEVALHDIISCFWGKRLDTVCHTCHGFFVDEPPIRTICQHRPGSPTASRVYVRVRNRHWACLITTCATFVPVSHVWDDSVRKANESRSHNDDAAYALIDRLDASLRGAEDSYESGVEFWHDYFSVPQWERVVRDSLLLRLPSIYHEAEEILVHFEDGSSTNARLLVLSSYAGAGLSLMEALRSIPLLRSLSVSQWMQRMWVTLEYSQSKAACAMDQSNTIWRHQKDNGLLARDTFTKLLDGGQTQLIGLFQHSKTFADSLRLPGEYLGEIANRNKDTRQICLGDAMELVARKQRQNFRDRFLAIWVLLNRDISPTGPSSVPERAVNACAWVWQNALIKNDYSAHFFSTFEGIRFP